MCMYVYMCKYYYACVSQGSLDKEKLRIKMYYKRGLIYGLMLNGIGQTNNDSL